MLQLHHSSCNCSTICMGEREKEREDVEGPIWEENRSLDDMHEWGSSHRPESFIDDLRARRHLPSECSHGDIIQPNFTNWPRSTAGQLGSPFSREYDNAIA